MPIFYELNAFSASSFNIGKRFNLVRELANPVVQQKYGEEVGYNADNLSGSGLTHPCEMQ